MTSPIPTPRAVKDINDDHARLPASKSKQWLNCTPSARLEASLPDKGSTYASEGTLAHRMGELRLRKYLSPMSPETFRLEMAEIKKDPLYLPEMEGHIDTYYEYVRDIVHGYKTSVYTAVEQRVDFSRWVPEGFGTTDFLAISGNTMHIVDLKYGKGVPVSADHNPQMMLYALGAYSAYGFLYDIRTIKVAVIQPRLDNISEWEVSLEELLAWAEAAVKPLAQMAWEGKGEFMPGEWCQFCKAKATCRARSDHYMALDYPEKKLPPQLTDLEIGAILEKAKDLTNWLGALQDYALKACLAGGNIPGWKAVEGRAVRVLDTDKAIPVLTQNGFEEAVLYRRSPITMTAIEQLVGKKKFAELCNPFITTPPGKPALAPATDKRPAITRDTVETDYAEPTND